MTIFHPSKGAETDGDLLCTSDAVLLVFAELSSVVRMRAPL